MGGCWSYTHIVCRHRRLSPTSASIASRVGRRDRDPIKFGQLGSELLVRSGRDSAGQGHDVTMDRYGHLFPAAGKEGARSLAQMFGTAAAG